MSAQSHLASYGISVSQARDFIVTSLDNLPGLLSVCEVYGVTNAMLAEIYGGVSESDVIAFFAASGLDSGILESDDTPVTPDAPVIVSELGDLLPDTIAGLASVIRLNEHEGVFANENLRAEVMAQVPGDKYVTAFNPGKYSGAEDGVFTPQEHKLPGLGDLPATWETMESLYYGTLVNMMKAIDNQELVELAAFVTQHGDEIGSKDNDFYDQFIGLFADALKDPAETNPWLSDAEIHSVVLQSTVKYVDQYVDTVNDSILYAAFQADGYELF